MIPTRDLFAAVLCCFIYPLSSPAFDTDDFNDGVRDPTKWLLPDRINGTSRLVETNFHLGFETGPTTGGDVWANWAKPIPLGSDSMISFHASIAPLPPFSESMALE